MRVFDSLHGGKCVARIFGLLNGVDLLRLGGRVALGHLLLLSARVALGHLLLLSARVALGHLLVVDLLSGDLLAWLHVDDLSAGLLALSLVVGLVERMGELHLPSSALGAEDH